MRVTMMERIWQGFWQLSDPKIWIASTIPMFIAAALSYGYTKTLDVGWFVLALLGIYLIEIGKNAVNEFVDYQTGVDRFITEDKRNPFSGGKKTIVDGKLTMKETMVIAVLTLLGAFIIGFFIAVLREPSIFWIGMIGLALAVFYSLPPFKLNYRGMGELAVGLAFGPLIMCGTFLLLTGTWSWEVVIAGLPVAFLITAVLWINQYPDYEADIQGGKRNWLVRIGKENGLIIYGLLYGGAYLSLLFLAILLKNPFWLLGFISLPLAIKSIKITRQHMNNIPKLLEANQKTIQIYIITGIVMTIASIMTFNI
ncbi:prenyltransferase [Bacillus sp. FJAT-49732]|uniref:Prenyltransferase n=2 Tax=Lederbergia citrisecunda TaxID=2833583 RepID=A0A942TIH7_9BACI|nr:prenyltransferase [Lederbergia citrisecunda]